MMSMSVPMRKCILGTTESKMKFFVGLFILAVAVFMIFMATVAFSGLAIATANSWILGGNFSDAWNSVWERKFIVFGWSMLFVFPISFRPYVKG